MDKINQVLDLVAHYHGYRTVVNIAKISPHTSPKGKYFRAENNQISFFNDFIMYSVFTKLITFYIKIKTQNKYIIKYLQNIP